MDDPISRTWDKESAPTSRKPTLLSRRWQRTLSAFALILFLAGVVAGAIRWYLGKPNPHFVPVFVANYRSVMIRDNLASLRNWQALRDGHYFVNVEASTPATEQEVLILAELDKLSQRGFDEEVVVYLSSYATLDKQGQVLLMPGNVRPDDPTTFLPLRDVLTEVHRCPSQHKLLVLELCWDFAEPKLGLLGSDVASALVTEVNAVDDPQLTVVTSCSSGQLGLVSVELGRSLFNYLFERALRGYADGYNANLERDGRVSVFELCRFLEVKVDRWAWTLFQRRQTPRVLRQGSDFDLIALAEGYPRADPPWDNTDEFAKTWYKQWEPREVATSVMAQPVYLSLALVEAHGLIQNDIHVEVLDLLTQAGKLTGKPTEVVAGKKKLADAFVGKHKDVPLEDLSWSVVTAARQDPDLNVDQIKLLDSLLLTRRTEPQYVETLWLHRVASSPSLAWSAERIRKSFAVVVKGERAVSEPFAFVWLKPKIARAYQLRHNAEVLFWSAGYVSDEALSLALTRAEELLDEVLAEQQVLVKAKHLLDEAFDFLPAYTPYLQMHPLTESTWQKAINATCELADRLWISVNTTTELPLDEIEHTSALLDEQLSILRDPFTETAVTKWLTSTDSSTQVPRYREFGSLLRCQLLDRKTRANVWKAHRKLGRELRDRAAHLDTVDFDAKQLTPRMQPEDKTIAQQQREDETLLRARTSLSLLRLAGLSDITLEPAQQSLAKRDMFSLADELRGLWNERLPQALANATSLERKDRLSRFLLPTDEAPAQTMRASTEQSRELLTWLVNRYRYEIREGQSVAFYTSAIRDLSARLEMAPDWHVDFDTPIPLALTRENPTAKFDLQWTLQGTVPPPAKATVTLFNPSRTSLKLTPIQTTSDNSVSLEIAWSSEIGDATPPQGFLIRVDVDGTSFHQRVSFATLPSAEPVELLLGLSDTVLSAWPDALRLRPLAAYQAYSLGLRNKTATPQSLLVELPGLAPQKVELQANQTFPLTWEGVAPKEGTTLPELKGPLTIRVLQAPGQQVLLERTLAVEIAHPHEYVQITEAEFFPKNPAQNQLRVQLRAKRMLSPPCVAELSLSPLTIPGFGGVKGGNLRGVVPADGTSALTLQGLNLQLAPSATDEGLVPIKIDDCERAFVLQVPFVRVGNAPVQARLLRQPSLRLTAPSFAKPGDPFVVGIQTDQAPDGCTLELSDGQKSSATPHADRTYKYPTPRQRRVGFALGPKGTMLFQTSLQDWQVALDTKGLLGRRILTAHLLSDEGRILRTATKEWTLDADPPEAVAFVRTQHDADKATLNVTATGEDSLTGISDVVFWIGKPVMDKLPPNTATVPGSAEDAGKTTWSATLQLPPMAKGKLDVSAQFTNGIGLTRVATTTVDLDGPAEPTTGTIEGTIFEGPRPQPKLPVVLFDAKGGQVDKTVTETDGTFRFEKVKPGEYKVQSIKTSSGRKGESPVTVEAGKTASVSVKLTL